MRTVQAARRRIFGALISVGVFVMLGAVAPECLANIGTFAPDCTTPKSVFNLSETVCVKAEGLNGYRLAWLNPDGYIVHRTDIINDPDSGTFTLPSTAQSSVAGLFTANNLGTWRATAVTSGNSVKTGAFFTVKDPDNKRVDLSIVKYNIGLPPTAGATFHYEVAVSNLGPDDAINVRFVDNVFLNATFNSLTQTSGLPFTCTGADCSIATFPNGAVAVFRLSFTAGAAGGDIQNTATVVSDTTDLNAADNTAIAPPLRVGSAGTPPACTLECRNVVASVSTTNNGTPGAIVMLPQPETFGTCGAVTLSPASGSFFPVGTTAVTASASGGGFCSFTVTVIDTPPPTVTCPADLSAVAPSGQLTVFVPNPAAPSSDVGFATATGSSVSVTAVRSDDLSVSDAYPIGITFVTWRATDDAERIASCTQKITVVSPDAPTIQCPPNRTFTASAGACQVTVSSSDIGLPTTGGSNVTVTSGRSDSRALTDPYPAGDTVITWTASNSLGSVSCVQRIHVKGDDLQPPVLTIPADLYATTSTCFAVLDDELGVASASDACSGAASVVRTGIPSNFVFPTGTTNVVYTATDSAGNVATAVQRVRVLESPAIRPIITVPADINVSTGAGATGCGAVVSDGTLGTAILSDNCPGVTLSRTGVPSGNFFPVGDTIVTYVATDASGNTASATQKVQVIDTTAPTITCPANLTIEPTCPTGAVAAWTAPAALDNCAGVTTSQSAGPPNGSVFPIGATTTVSYAATDAAGNTASCSFTVTVLTTQAALEQLRARVASSSLRSDTKQGLIPKLDAAIDGLNKPSNKQSCQQLANFSNSVQNYLNHGDLLPAQAQAWLTSAARISNAIGCTNNPCS